MKNYYDIHFLLTAVILSTSLAVVLSSRKTKGKGLLLSYLAINLSVISAYYILNLLLRTKTMTAHTYEYFINGIPGVLLDIISLGGPASLLLYVIHLKMDASSAGISAEQAAAEQAIINRCAFGGGAILCGLNFLVGGHVPGGAVGGAIGGGLGSLIGMAVNAIGRSQCVASAERQQPEVLPKNPTSV